MSDFVFVTGLKGQTQIGVHDWEKRIRQTVVLDLQLYVDLQPAAQNDDLRQTVDYASVSQRVLEFVDTARYELIESLAEAVAGLLLAEFAVQKLTLRLSKPGAVPQASSVGVEINRPA